MDDSYEKIESQIRDCAACGLRALAKHVVVGSGDVKSRIMLIGEAPGAEEDKEGLPFVGRSGKFLTQLMEEKGLRRDKIFITNMVKCRPSQNRTPTPEEVSACRKWLDIQIGLIAPEIIISVGNIPTRALLDTKEGITALRGSFYKVRTKSRQVWIRPVFHPAYLLRNRKREDGSPVNLTLADFAEVKFFIDEMNR